MSPQEQACQQFQQWFLCGQRFMAEIHPFGCALTAVLQPSESSDWCSCRQLRSCPLPRGVFAQNFCASADALLRTMRRAGAYASARLSYFGDGGYRARNHRQGDDEKISCSLHGF